MRLLLLAAIALGSATPAWASEWYRVSVQRDSIGYVDAASALRNGNEVVVWEDVLYFQPTRTGMIRMKSRGTYNCRDGSYTPTYYISYDSDGTNDSWNPTTGRSYAAPGTVAHRTYRFVCGDRSLGTLVSSPDADFRRYRN